MHTRHLKVVPETADDAGPTTSSTSRDTVLASVVLGILFLGIASGAVAPDSNAELRTPDAQASTPADRLQQDFIYFPSQYVNQGTTIEVEIPTF